MKNDMDYLCEFKKNNIKFNIVHEADALDIMRNDFSFYKIWSYTSLFEKYRSGDNCGLFVNLDFGQLYYLAKIDSELSCILMCMCLDVEEKLKTKLIFDAEKICDTNSLLIEYYNNDRKYLEHNYTADNNDTINNKNIIGTITQMSFAEFLDVAQFGTLERLIHYFYRKYAFDMYGVDFLPFEAHLSSVRRIRNIVAHNNSILNKLAIQTDYYDLKMLAFLGQQGIKNRTLHTNMSKLMISDLCGFFDIYFNLINKRSTVELLEDFDKNCIQEYKHFFINHDLLESSYNFLKNAIIIFQKNKKST